MGSLLVSGRVTKRVCGLSLAPCDSVFAASLPNQEYPSGTLAALHSNPIIPLKVCRFSMGSSPSWLRHFLDTELNIVHISGPQRGRMGLCMAQCVAAAPRGWIGNNLRRNP